MQDLIGKEEAGAGLAEEGKGTALRGKKGEEIVPLEEEAEKIDPREEEGEGIVSRGEEGNSSRFP